MFCRFNVGLWPMIVTIKNKQYNLIKAKDAKLYPEYEHVDKNDLVYLVYRDFFIRGFLVITGKKQGKILFCTPSVPHKLNENLFEDVSPETIDILSKYGKIQKLYDLLCHILLVFGCIIGFLCFIMIFIWAVNYDSIIVGPICGCIAFCCLFLIPINCCSLYEKELHFVYNN